MKRDELLKIAKPILFNSDMVIAILSDRKTRTMRTIKPQPAFQNGETGTPVRCDDGSFTFKINEYSEVYDHEVKPRYSIGDILYVREAFREFSGMIYGYKGGTYILLDDYYGYQYKADNTLHFCKGSFPLGDIFDDWKNRTDFEKWRPSIHMPKEAARIFLRVTNVSVAKLQDMSFDDYIKEGVYVRPEAYNDPDNAFFQAQRSFAYLWNTTTPKKDLDKYGYEANPWAYVYSFERMEADV